MAVSYIWRHYGTKTFTNYISRRRKRGFLFKTDIYNTKHVEDARQLLLQGKDIFTFQTKCQIYAEPRHVIPKTMRHLKQNKYLFPLYVSVVMKFSSSTSSSSSSSLRTALLWKAITTSRCIITQMSAVHSNFAAEASNHA